MVYKIIKFFISIFVVLTFVGCSDSSRITLNLSSGDFTGKYKGNLENGVPNGFGKFIVQNSDGLFWVYEGDFVNGHLHGVGKKTFENGDIEDGTFENDALITISEASLANLFQDKDNSYLTNKPVIFAGKVSQILDPGYYTVNTIAVEVLNQPENIVVDIPFENLEVQVGDYIEIEGIIENTNYKTVRAKTYRKLSYADYIEKLKPSIKTVDVNQSQVQNGYKVTILKVSFLETETRVIFRFENNGVKTVGFNTRLNQGARLAYPIEDKENFYEEPQTELEIGEKTEGILIYRRLDIKDLEIVVSPFTSHPQEKLDNYIFEIQVN